MTQLFFFGNVVVKIISNKQNPKKLFVEFQSKGGPIKVPSVFWSGWWLVLMDPWMMVVGRPWILLPKLKDILQLKLPIR